MIQAMIPELGDIAVCQDLSALGTKLSNGGGEKGLEDADTECFLLYLLELELL